MNNKNIYMKIEVKLTVYSFQIIEMREWFKKEIFFLTFLKEKSILVL